ncbi:MAG TPA: hypothetical protein VL262_15740 [Vicinamibacterales bacterium]|nr:hypothetical protein [Vicinamibacterales bacterium]
MKLRNRIIGACALVMLANAGTAAAGDAVRASVTPNTPPTPLVMQNGTGLTPGTYAVGTIQLFYTVQAFQFPTGPFATFDLGMAVVPGKTNPTTAYPAPLTLRQTGADLTLLPDTSSFLVGNAAWTGSTRVTISIPEGVSNDDGTELTGNLQLETAGGTHLDTVTTVQVHIKLVHPTSCLKLYVFVTDQDFTQVVTSATVNLTPRGKLSATNPGQLSENLLVVNTCGAAESFDVRVAMDPRFKTNPSGNPGNAVFTYSQAGEQDPSSFNLLAFGAGTGQGQLLQLTNVTVGAGDMFLMTVHMGIDKDQAWTGGTSGTFSFSGAMYVPGTAFTTLVGGVDAANPATTTVSYTVQ